MQQLLPHSLICCGKNKQPEQVQWTPECETAFEQLKANLTHSPVLKVPEVNKPYIVYTDASDVGLGAVLSQLGDDENQHPIAYATRKLKPRETRYSTIEKECLAVVWALKFFEHYLYGQLFTVVTDHRPLTWLSNMKNANPRLARWVVTLQQYNPPNAQTFQRGDECHKDVTTEQADLTQNTL